MYFAAKINEDKFVHQRAEKLSTEKMNEKKNRKKLSNYLYPSKDKITKDYCLSEQSEVQT